MGFESDRYIELELRKAHLQEEIRKTSEQMEERLQRQRVEFENDLEQQLQAKDHEIKKHKDLIALVQRKFEGLMDLEAAEHEAGIGRANLRNHVVLEEQKQVARKLTGEQGILQRGLEKTEQERMKIEREQLDAAMAVRNLKDQTE